MESFFMILIIVAIIIGPILLVCYFMKPKPIEEGTLIGKCISKYSEQTGTQVGLSGNGYGGVNGRIYNNFFVTLEDKNRHRETYGIETREFGKINEGETAEVNYVKYKSRKYFINKVSRILNS